MDIGARVSHAEQSDLTGTVTGYDGPTVTVVTDHDHVERVWPSHKWGPVPHRPSYVRLPRALSHALADHIRPRDPGLADLLITPAQRAPEGRGYTYFHELNGVQHRDLGRYTADLLAESDNGAATKVVGRRELTRAIERILNPEP